MTKSHKHGLIFRVRDWLGIVILPPCTRQMLLDALIKGLRADVDEMATRLGVASVTGDVAAEDQARAALKELGEVFTGREGGEPA